MVSVAQIIQSIWRIYEKCCVYIEIWFDLEEICCKALQETHKMLGYSNRCLGPVHTICWFMFTPWWVYAYITQPWVEKPQQRAHNVNINLTKVSLSLHLIIYLSMRNNQEISFVIVYSYWCLCRRHFSPLTFSQQKRFHGERLPRLLIYLTFPIQALQKNSLRQTSQGRLKRLPIYATSTLVGFQRNW